MGHWDSFRHWAITILSFLRIGLSVFRRRKEPTSTNTVKPLHAAIESTEVTEVEESSHSFILVELEVRGRKLRRGKSLQCTTPEKNSSSFVIA
jgi:hypothetical protein